MRTRGRFLGSALVACLAVTGSVDGAMRAASGSAPAHAASAEPRVGASATAPYRDARRRAVECRHVRFVGVAGSGEQRKGGTYGATINALRKRVIDRVGTQYVASDYVKYDPEPAELPQLWDVVARGERSDFISGFRRGVREFKSLLRDRLKACPDEILVPAGYSQGAMVVVQGLVELKAEKRWDILDRVAAVDLVASPFAHKQDQSILIGSAKADHHGIFTLIGRPARLSADWIGWVYEACNRGDIVCDTHSRDLAKQYKSGGIKTHEAYKSGNQAELEKLARLSANRVGWLPTDALQPVVLTEGQSWSGNALTGGASVGDLVMTPRSGWPAGSSLSGGRITLPPLAPGVYTMTASLRHKRVAPGAVRTLTVRVSVSPRAVAPPPPPPPPPPASPFVNVTNGAQAGAPAISADGTKLAFRSSAATLTPNDAAGTDDVFVWDRASGSTTRITGNMQDWMVSDPSISGDGRYVAYVAAPTDSRMPVPIAPGQVYLWDRHTGNTTQVTSGNEASWAVDMSDDGTTLSFASAASDLVPDDDDNFTDVFVWRRGTSGFTNLTPGDHGGWGGSVSGDGRHVYFCRNDGPYSSSGLVEWDRDSDQRFVFTTGQNGCGLPGVSYDGAKAAQEHDYRMWVVERQADSFGWTPIPSSDDGVSAPAISGDGRIVAFHSGQGAALSFVVRVWNSATNSVLTLPKANATNPDIDHSGRYVAFTSSDGINLWTRP